MTEENKTVDQSDELLAIAVDVMTEYRQALEELA